MYTLRIKIKNLIKLFKQKIKKRKNNYFILCQKKGVVKVIAQNSILMPEIKSLSPFLESKGADWFCYPKNRK